MTQRSDLQICDDNNNPVSVTIEDALGLVINSTLVTQAFLRALATIVTKVAGAPISQVIVEIGSIARRTELVLHQQRIVLRISKLGVVTEECAKAVMKAELQKWPEEMRQEYTDRLYGLFYEEMSKIAPRR